MIIQIMRIRPIHFFYQDFLRKNSDLVGLYNSSINNIADLYKLLQTIKNFFETIFKSKNLETLKKNVPIYMFKDKENFITIYSKTGPNNKSKIVKLIYKTEKLVRENNNNYFAIGNRFLLNLKKILK